MSTGQTRVGGAIAYNAKLKKWIMMTSAGWPLTGANLQHLYGQYEKAYREEVLNYKGLRGIGSYDITNPSNPELLQEFSTGQLGDTRSLPASGRCW